MEANMTELTTGRGLLRWRTIAHLTVAPDIHASRCCCRPRRRRGCWTRTDT